MLLAKRKKKRVIVFVCTGNTCRSPMAQGLLQDYLDKNNVKHIEVKTAGVMTIPGLLPTPEAVQVMDNGAIDIRKHRSAPLTPEMIRKSDLILGMTPFHVQFALRMSEDARGKTHLLKEFTKSDLKNYQITDPMGATLEVYKRVFREIKLAVDKLVEMDIVKNPIEDDFPSYKKAKKEKEAAKVVAIEELEEEKPVKAKKEKEAPAKAKEAPASKDKKPGAPAAAAAAKKKMDEKAKEAPAKPKVVPVLAKKVAEKPKAPAAAEKSKPVPVGAGAAKKK